MKKVELLAPAGNWEGFIGAIQAGADAVYLGGHKFGARAYANNFTQEEVCEGIRYAHLWSRKVYLTINTLFKDQELQELETYLNPYVKEGLDGVIIQDLGVLGYVRERFPQLELHISTQMSIMGSLGAQLVKDLGGCRIVPARELSLDEIIAIKKNVEIEIETFVHGAMCYCYSGSCLFSSILGGRSGNRGRCAQPCRLPYEVKNDGFVINHSKNKEKGKNRVTISKHTEDRYPLSLKDMCTLSSLPELIEAGIDSFKIEGRMKKPEYAAGVVALYRHYIDLYYQLKKDNREKEYKVTSKDLTKIKSLYLRSDIQEGYYFKQNGPEMITLEKPNYSGVSEELLLTIRNQYINKKNKIPIQGMITLEVGKVVEMTIYRDGEQRIQVQGAEVLEAINRPMEEQAIRKQIEKTGNSNFEFIDLKVEMKGACFLPVKALNEVRRLAILGYEEFLLKEYNSRNSQEHLFKLEQRLDNKIRSAEVANIDSSILNKGTVNKEIQKAEIVVSVLTQEQLAIVLKQKSISTIYIPVDLFLNQRNTIDSMSGIKDKKIYFILPYILRKKSYPYLLKMKKYLELPYVQGAIVRNFEEIQWLKEIDFTKEIIADANIYCFNQESKKRLQLLNIKGTIPYELNKYELDKLGYDSLDIVVYGKIPMMITANCVNKTMNGCNKEDHAILKDRYQKEFFVSMNCIHCYNVIYNSVPLSHHHNMAKFSKGHNKLRLDFTDENQELLIDIITYFQQLLIEGIDSKTPIYREYTKGHWKRGVE